MELVPTSERAVALDLDSEQWKLGPNQIRARPYLQLADKEGPATPRTAGRSFTTLRLERPGEAGNRTAGLPLVVVVVVVVVVLAAAPRRRGPGSTLVGGRGRGDMDRPSLPVAAAVVAVVLVCCSGLCRGERLGARECEDLGFTGLALCSDCNALSEFVKDQGTPGSSLWRATPRTRCAAAEC